MEVGTGGRGRERDEPAGGEHLLGAPGDRGLGASQLAAEPLGEVPGARGVKVVEQEALRPVRGAEEAGACPSRSTRAPKAALAAVRRALISEPSRIAVGRPVPVSLRISTAEARGMPFSRLAGNEETHFSPATSKPQPRKAGRAMMRSRSLPGKRRKLEWGSMLWPSRWAT